MVLLAPFHPNDFGLLAFRQRFGKFNSIGLILEVFRIFVVSEHISFGQWLKGDGTEVKESFHSVDFKDD
jgi:hypothetical protein